MTCIIGRCISADAKLQHAHVCSSEIIGFLGGHWNEETNVLNVKGAFPCRALDIGSNAARVNVEMDPVSALEVRDFGSLLKSESKRRSY